MLQHLLTSRRVERHVAHGEKVILKQAKVTFSNITQLPMEHKITIIIESKWFWSILFWGRLLFVCIVRIFLGIGIPLLFINMLIEWVKERTTKNSKSAHGLWVGVHHHGICH